MCTGYQYKPFVRDIVTGSWGILTRKLVTFHLLPFCKRSTPFMTQFCTNGFVIRLKIVCLQRNVYFFNTKLICVDIFNINCTPYFRRVNSELCGPRRFSIEILSQRIVRVGAVQVFTSSFINKRCQIPRRSLWRAKVECGSATRHWCPFL